MGDFYRYLVESFNGEWVNKNQNWAGGDDHQPARETEEARAGSKDAQVHRHPAQFGATVEDKILEIRRKLDEKCSASGLSTGCREKFAVFDRDRRGKISTRAFITGVRSIMIAITKEEVAAIFKTADRDRDGFLSIDEFRRAFGTDDPFGLVRERCVKHLPGSVVDLNHDVRNLHIVPPRASYLVSDVELEKEAMQEPSKTAAQLRYEIEKHEAEVHALNTPGGAVKTVRGKTPKPGSIAGGLRHEPKDHASLSLAWDQEKLYGTGDPREPELKAKAREEWARSVGKDPLMDEWPAAMVASGWRWSRAELVARIQEKTLSKTSSQAGSL